jgi:hypothetical protein
VCLWPPDQDAQALAPFIVELTKAAVERGRRMEQERREKATTT